MREERRGEEGERREPRIGERESVIRTHYEAGDNVPWTVGFSILLELLVGGHLPSASIPEGVTVLPQTKISLIHRPAHPREEGRATTIIIEV